MLTAALDGEGLLASLYTHSVGEWAGPLFGVDFQNEIKACPPPPPPTETEPCPIRVITLRHTVSKLDHISRQRRNLTCYVVTKVSEKINASIIKEEGLFSETLITCYQLLQCTLSPYRKSRLSHKHKPRYGLSVRSNKAPILRQERSALLAQ